MRRTRSTVQQRNSPCTKDIYLQRYPTLYTDSTMYTKAQSNNSFYKSQASGPRQCGTARAAANRFTKEPVRTISGTQTLTLPPPYLEADPGVTSMVGSLWRGHLCCVCVVCVLSVCVLSMCVLYRCVLCTCMCVFVCVSVCV